MRRGRETFQAFRFIMVALSTMCNVFPESFRQYLLNFFRDTKGLKGLGIRYVILRSLVKECGDNVSVHPGVYLLNASNLSLGNNVSIHPMCYFDASGGISIGNDVSIAHGVSILSFEHIFSDISVCIKDQGTEPRPVTILDNVWIGAKATIVSGNTIGSGSIVGAGSVVTHDVPGFSIVAGVPARVVKGRQR